jgi:hypothetical protein
MAQLDDLDTLFATAAMHRVTPSVELVGRILKDADDVQAKPPVVVASSPQRGWFGTLADWFGGGASLAGMSFAAMTGLYLGVAQPLPMTALTELVTGSTTIDSLELLPSTGTIWVQE